MAKPDEHDDPGLRFVECVAYAALAFGIVCFMALLMWGWTIANEGVAP